MIEDSPTHLLSLEDPPNNLKSELEKSFGIRCPNSIVQKIPNVVYSVFDYESECDWSNTPLNETAFCGKCAKKNSNTILSNANIPLTYNFVKTSKFIQA